MAATLNKCLKFVNGDYIARMDGDDISLPTRFEEQIRFLENNKEYSLVGTQMISFDKEGDKGKKTVEQLPNERSLRFNTPFAHATIMVRPIVYEVLKGYRVSKEIRRCEDVDLWFRFFAAGFKGYNLNIPLYKVRETVDEFKRRKLKYGIDTAIVCYRGFKMLKYPKKDFIFVLKPIIVCAIPAWLMKKIHNAKDR